MCKIRTLSLCLFLLIVCKSNFIFAQYKTNNAILQNGLQIFVTENFSDALIHIDLVVNAGFLMQTKENAGFFELYSSMFYFQNNFLEEVSVADFSYACNETQTRYTISFLPNHLESVLSFLSLAISNPTFEDKIIDEKTLQFIKEQKDIQNSLAGFITSSIETRLLQDYPWKTRWGANPTAISKLKTSQIRSILSDIQKNWYAPNNSLISVSGQIDSNDFINMAEKYFQSWETNNQIKFQSTASISSTFPTDQKYVIVSDDFSSDLIQLMTVYDYLPNQAVISEINKNDSVFKRKVISDSSLGIKTPLDIYIEKRIDNKKERLSIQALIEKSDKTSPIEQNNNILSLFQASYKELSSDDINKNVVSFLTVSEETYLSNKKLFEKNKWQKITKENGFWFYNEKYNAKASNTAEIKDEQTTSNLSSQNKKQNQSDLYKAKNISDFSTFSLANGINVFAKKTEDATSCIILEITCPELLDDKIDNKTKLATFIISTNIFATWIKEATNKDAIINFILPTQNQEKIKSTISIEFESNEGSAFITNMIDSLIYGKLTPVQADEIIYEIKLKSIQEKSTLEGILFSSAIHYFFPNSLFDVYNDRTKDIFSKIVFSDIQTLLTLMLDASLYKIIICTSQNTIENDIANFELFVNHKMGSSTPKINNNEKNLVTKITSAIKKGFQALNNVRKKQQKNELDCTMIFVPIKRVFASSAIKPSDKTEATPDLPSQPAQLEETKIFFDPLQFYIEAPKKDSPERPVFEVLLTELCDNLSKKLKEGEHQDNTNTFMTSDVSFKIIDTTDSLASILITNISDVSKTKQLFLETINNKKNIFSEKVKDKTISNALNKTSTSQGISSLMLEYSLQDLDVSTYLDWYISIEQTSKSVAQAIYDEWFVNANITGFSIK